MRRPVNGDRLYGYPAWHRGCDRSFSGWIPGQARDDEASILTVTTPVVKQAIVFTDKKIYLLVYYNLYDCKGLQRSVRPPALSDLLVLDDQERWFLCAGIE